MTPVFRIILIVVSLLTTFYILKKIRQSKLQIEYAIFWILFAGVLIVFSLFPWLVSMFTRLIGMQLPVNFIFLFFIFVLLVKMFLMTSGVAHSPLKYVLGCLKGSFRDV